MEYHTKIKNMSFDELRYELSLANGNPVKELLIRKIIRHKYNQYKKKKKNIQPHNNSRKDNERVSHTQYGDRTKYKEHLHTIRQNKSGEHGDVDMINLANEILNDIGQNGKGDGFNEIGDNDLSGYHRDAITEELMEILDDIEGVNSNNKSDNDNNNYGTAKDGKFVNEIKRDQVNNNLMNRMNSDIFINNMNKTKNKNFESPFSNDMDDKYASFKNDPTIIPNNDFSNNRIMN
jgi:hypothetical protein